MPLENILQALEAETERLVTEIAQATQAEIDRILGEARAEAAVVRQKHIAAIKAPLRAEQARILNQAKLEALQIVLGTREELIRAGLEAAARLLAERASAQQYPDLLQQLTAEAVAALGVNEVCLRVRSSDMKLMDDIVQRLDISATVTGGLEDNEAMAGNGGGVVAATHDGRISLINTPTARLSRAADLYRLQIAQMMFEVQAQED
jgi:vacuolar-type H+-ATPase subunit E/Vma4